MFGMTANVQDTTKRVEDAAEKATFGSFGHGAARISKDAKESIETSPVPSKPDEPPHTRGKQGHNLRGAIRFDADKEGALIGPLHSLVGTAGEAHEFGGRHRGETFDERSFMGPALLRNLDRLAGDWEGSIGE